MFGVFGWLLVGFIFGLLAKAIVPRNDDGALLRVLIGVFGALLGGVLGIALGLFDYGSAGLLALALGGSVMTLVLYRVSVTH